MFKDLELISSIVRPFWIWDPDSLELQPLGKKIYPDTTKIQNPDPQLYIKYHSIRITFALFKEFGTVVLSSTNRIYGISCTNAGQIPDIRAFLEGYCVALLSSILYNLLIKIVLERNTFLYEKGLEGERKKNFVNFNNENLKR